MSVTAALLTICFIVCHGGPAGHFSEFAKYLKENGYVVEVFATGQAVAKFEGSGINPKEFNPQNLDLDSQVVQRQLAVDLAIKCSNSRVVITDVGHLLMKEVHERIDKEFPKVIHLAYYDNPESYVPVYSKIAAEVIKPSQAVLFANAKLANEMIFSGKESFGIGYYPMEHAKKILERRKTEHNSIRSQYLSKHQIEDKGQKILVYFGGNNEEYFTKAFPRFLKILDESFLNLSNYIILFHQHPGAKSKDIDGILVAEWQKNHPSFLLKRSDMNLDDVLVLSEGALYYQTSMNLEFFAIRLPKIIQVGHEPFKDMLVRNNLCPSVVNSVEFMKALEKIESSQIEKSDAEIAEMVGVNSSWSICLEGAIHSIHPH